MHRETRPLRGVTIVFAAAYCLFVFAASIPATRPSIFSITTLPSFGLELSLTYLLFVLFAVGLAAWWWSDVIAGVAFVLWYAFVLWADAFSSAYGMGGGIGPFAGIPVLAIGSILIGWSVWHAYKERAAHPPVTASMT